MRVVLALVAALAVPALGVQDQNGTAVVRGHAVDAVTGRPLHRIVVHLDPRPRTPLVPGIDAQPPRRSAVTDDSGAFEIASLAPCDYAVYASGYSRYLQIGYGQTRPGGGGKLLTVRDNDRADITLRAWP